MTKKLLAKMILSLYVPKFVLRIRKNLITLGGNKENAKGGLQ
jgi:hypothetical protein